MDNNTIRDQLAEKAGGDKSEKNMVILESKRKRVERDNNMGNENEEVLTGLVNLDGPKNLIETGPVVQMSGIMY